MRTLLIIVLMYLGYVLVKKLVKYHIIKKVKEAEKQFYTNVKNGGGNSGHGFNEKDIIDVDYKEVEDNDKKLNR